MLSTAQQDKHDKLHHNKLRILHSESSLGWGGQENRTMNELLGMRERGHDLAVVGRPGAKLLARAAEAGFTTFAVDMRGLADLPGLWGLRRVIQQFAPEIVNTHSGRDTQLAGIAARSLGKNRPKIVRTRHLALPITSRFTYSVLPDHVVTVSEHVRSYLRSAGVPAQQVTTVATGVDLSRYDVSNPELNTTPAPRLALRQELGLPENAVLVGTVAILRAKKGHAQILDAVPQVLARFPEAHFVFAGDGPQTENLQQRIAAEGYGERVHLLGLRRDVVRVLAALDVFLLPTHQEALGTAFIEAGAMGLPAIGTAIDGVPEVIQDEQTGLLVPAQASGGASGAAIATAVNRLLADPALRQHYGAAAAQFVRHKFSRQAMVTGMEAVYRQLLGQALPTPTAQP